MLFICVREGNGLVSYGTTMKVVENIEGIDGLFERRINTSNIPNVFKHKRSSLRFLSGRICCNEIYAGKKQVKCPETC